jgi:hypothetical protein
VLAALALGVVAAWLFRRLHNLMHVVVALTPVVLAFVIARGLVVPQLPQIVPAGWLAASNSIVLVCVAAALAAGAAVSSRRFPRENLRPLMHSAALLIFLIISVQIFQNQTAGTRTAFQLERHLQGRLEEMDEQAETHQKVLEKLPFHEAGDPAWRQGVLQAAVIYNATEKALQKGPVWPVAVAGLIFLYLWWLAVLTFDLTFIWHRYVRHSASQRYLQRALPPPVPDVVPKAKPSEATAAA